MTYTCMKGVVLSALILGLTMCSPDTPRMAEPTVSSPEPARSPWYDRQQLVTIDRTARLMASALADQQASQALQEALRDSPWSEHKVALTELFADSPTNALLLAVATQSHMAPAQVLTLIRSLPPIDVYVPFLDHRHTWRTGAPIAVATLVDTVSAMFGYLPNGVRVAFDRRSTTAPAVPLLLLGPAEFRVLRPEPRPVSPDLQTIEDDGEFARELRAVQCLDACGGGGGGSGGGGTTGPLSGLVIATSHVCDNGFCGEGNEFEFRATANGVRQSPTMRCTSIPSTGSVTLATWPYCNTTVVHQVSPPTAPYVDVDVVETDGLSADDKFRDYVTPAGGYASSIPRIVDNPSRLRSFLLYKFDTGLNCDPPILSGNPYCDNVQVTFKW